jgi:hypothetical protein
MKLAKKGNRFQAFLFLSARYVSMKRKSSILISAIIGLLLPLFFTGCGYTTRSLISRDYHTIHIVAFENKIDITQETDSATKYKVYKPFLETDVTRAIINQFLFDGNLKTVSSDSADLILKGSVVEFRRDPLRYNESDQVTEYRLNLVVDMSLFDTRASKTLWEEHSFTGDTTYFTSGPQAKSEDVAISDALSDLARRVVERVVDVW